MDEGDPRLRHRALLPIRGALRSGPGRRCGDAAAQVGPMTALLERASRRYIAGHDTADAVRVASELRLRGLSCTLGYWDSPGDSPQEVAARARDAAAAMA